MKLGILPERSRPGCPQDNPRHERYYEGLFGPVLLGYLDTHTHAFHHRLTATISRHLGLDILTED